jgi:hypothetical protein
MLYCWKVPIIHLYKGYHLTKYQKLHLRKATVPPYIHNIIPWALMKLMLPQTASQPLCEALIIVFARRKRKHQWRLTNHTALKLCAWSTTWASCQEANVNPVPSFVVYFDWAVKTSDGTNQSVSNHLHWPESHLQAVPLHGSDQLCRMYLEMNIK